MVTHTWTKARPLPADISAPEIPERRAYVDALWARLWAKVDIPSALAQEPLFWAALEAYEVAHPDPLLAYLRGGVEKEVFDRWMLGYKLTLDRAAADWRGEIPL